MNFLPEHKFLIARNTAQSGQVIMAAVMVFLTLSIVVVTGISSPIVAQIRNSTIMLESRKGVTAAETLNDDALYRLNSGRSLPATIVLSLNESTSTAQVTDVGGVKQIISTGQSRNTDRITSSQFSQGAGVSINYGLQVGNGGLQMSGGPTIYGNVYSNGDITGSGGSTITGSALAAPVNSQTTHVYNIFANTSYVTVTSTPPFSQNLGQANNVQMIGQSFTNPSAASISSVAFNIKKTGSPANATLRIYNNSAGNPGSTQIGASGSLSASLVTNSFDWVEVYPTTPIALSSNVSYWVVLEYQGNNTNYYTLGTNDGVAGPGMAMKLRNRSGSSWGSWYAPASSTADMLFQSYTGGVSTISGVSINGIANASVVNSSTVSGNLYCQTGSGNNKSCDASQPTPSPLGMPISAANIQTWKDEASTGTIRNSSWSLGGSTATSTSGAMKIVGNLTVSAGATLTLGGPLYVTGNIYVDGGARIQLASSYGTGDEKIIATRVELSGGGLITGNGQAGSYMIVIADGVDNGTNYAIEASGGTGSVVLIAPNGTIEFTGGASAKAAVAYRMVMSGGTTLVYETGLADISFTSGPSGAWNVDNWKEIAP